MKGFTTDKGSWLILLDAGSNRHLAEMVKRCQYKKEQKGLSHLADLGQPHRNV